MPENVPNVRHERPPLVFPIVLIIVGALFLYANYRPAFDPWYVMKTYWPLILIFVGLAQDFRFHAAQSLRSRSDDRHQVRSVRRSEPLRSHRRVRPVSSIRTRFRTGARSRRA